MYFFSIFSTFLFYVGCRRIDISHLWENIFWFPRKIPQLVLINVAFTNFCSFGHMRKQELSFYQGLNLDKSSALVVSYWNFKRFSCFDLSPYILTLINLFLFLHIRCLFFLDWCGLLQLAAKTKKIFSTPQNTCFDIARIYIYIEANINN